MWRGLWQAQSRKPKKFSSTFAACWTVYEIYDLNMVRQKVRLRCPHTPIETTATVRPRSSTIINSHSNGTACHSFSARISLIAFEHSSRAAATSGSSRPSQSSIKSPPLRMWKKYLGMSNRLRIRTAVTDSRAECQLPCFDAPRDPHSLRTSQKARNSQLYTTRR